MDKRFKKESTEQAFNAWLAIGGGINSNPKDVERFYEFAREYFKNGEVLEKEVFVKMCKKFTHTTRQTNRGICQKYYEKLKTIVEYLKWDDKR